MKKVGYFILIISLFLAFIISIGFYFFSYKPNQDELMRATNRINSLTAEIRTQEKVIAGTRNQIARMDLGAVNLNYFKRSGVSGEEKTSLFLRGLNDLTNTLGIRFLSITPVASEKRKGYIKDAFDIRIKTDFERLLYLMFHLQNTLGLNIDRLDIKAEESDAFTEITAVMKLNTLEMTDKKDIIAKSLKGLRALHLENEPKMKDIKQDKTQKIESGFSKLEMLEDSLRDPFAKPFKVKKIQERLKHVETELNKSELLGIIDFEGERHAIIGRNTVKKGDRIFNMDVIDITHDKVVLGSGEVKFTYRIRKDETY